MKRFRFIFWRTLTEGGTVSTGYVGGFGVVDRPQRVDGTITYFNWL
jgi:hypothetical protein